MQLTSVPSCSKLSMALFRAFSLSEYRTIRSPIRCTSTSSSWEYISLLLRFLSWNAAKETYGELVQLIAWPRGLVRWGQYIGRSFRRQRSAFAREAQRSLPKRLAANHVNWTHSKFAETRRSPPSIGRNTSERRSPWASCCQAPVVQLVEEFATEQYRAPEKKPAEAGWVSAAEVRAASLVRLLVWLGEVAASRLRQKWELLLTRSSAKLGGRLHNLRAA